MRQQRLSEIHFGWAVARAEYYARKHRIDQDDVISDALLGLVKAEKQFNASLGIPFQGYALRIIEGYMKHGHRNRIRQTTCWTREIWDYLPKLQYNRTLFRQRHGRWPTDKELSEVTDIPIDKVRYILNATAPISLNTKLHEEDPFDMIERLSDIDNPLSRVELDALIDALSPRERKAIRLLSAGYVQQEVAKYLGCSQMGVSRIVQSVRKTLKEAA